MNNTDSVHNAGATRHPGEWLAANMHACEGAAASDLVVYTEPGRIAIPRIVLRVLDGLKIDAGMTWDKTTKSWLARQPESVAAPSHCAVATGSDARSLAVELAKLIEKQDIECEYRNVPTERLEALLERFLTERGIAPSNTETCRSPEAKP